MSPRQTSLDFESPRITLLEILAQHRSGISLYSKARPSRVRGILCSSIVLASVAGVVFLAYPEIGLDPLPFDISACIVVPCILDQMGYIDVRSTIIARIFLFLAFPLVVLFYCYIWLLRRIRFDLFAPPISKIAVTRKQFALYLRSFNDDEKAASEKIYSFIDDPLRYARSVGNRFAGQAKIEKLFGDRFTRYVPTACIGRPTEGYPGSPLGRFYVNQDAWKDVVYKLMIASHIIILRVASTPGLQWELEAALSKHTAHKVVLFLCSDNGSPFFRSKLQTVANSLEIDMAEATIPDMA
jgi:hypothetical protein